MRLLKDQERSQAWLARQLRMNESQLSHTLAGRRRLPEEFWPRIAEILRVSVIDLLAERPAA